MAHYLVGEKATDGREVRVFTIPLLNAPDIQFALAVPMTRAEWVYVLRVLATMKPGLLESAAPQDGA
jgi:hypothetical protein